MACMHIITSTISPFVSHAKTSRHLLSMPSWWHQFLFQFTSLHLHALMQQTTAIKPPHPLLSPSRKHQRRSIPSPPLPPSDGRPPPLLFPMAAAPNPSNSSPTKWNHMINLSMLCRWFYLLGMTATIGEIFSLLFISYISPCWSHQITGPQEIPHDNP